MVTITKYERKTNKLAYVECVCDSETDIAELAKKSQKWIAGSNAFVIESGAVYMRNSNNEWREI